MKNSFRKLIPVAAALGFAFAASSAQAFTLKDGTNVLATDSTTLDWNATGSGVAKGVGPFGSPLTVGQTFQFLYQSNLASVDGDTTALFNGLDFNANGVKGAGKTFEFTIVAKMTEKVTNLTGATAEFGLAGTAADNKVAIYYDTKANASTTGGTGFDDGTLIALLTIVPSNTQSTFTIVGAGGQGSTKLSAGKVEAGDFIDPNYLDGVSSLLFGVNFESNLNFPAGNSATLNFHKGGSSLFPDYTVNTSKDIVFKVDGSNTFTNAVPEPGTMMLLGMGMLGLVGAQRRRRAPKA
ncbi:flocculation-associated PEP-CTERM protein PepA [Massilia putida]|uniref:flocculation-associated PEP-CTERM protein PepA n=1 Tax=Massilia putida TaxID=1141883 RepID=UPI0009510983|nr:flocculation-associated PEP-CTERM protein PepA [Massilia putida]